MTVATVRNNARAPEWTTGMRLLTRFNCTPNAQRTDTWLSPSSQHLCRLLALRQNSAILVVGAILPLGIRKLAPKSSALHGSCYPSSRF